MDRLENVESAQRNEPVASQERQIKSFKIDVEQIRKIWYKFQEFSNSENAEVTFITSANRTYTSGDITELINFENSVHDSIIGIQFHCVNSYRNKMNMTIGSIAVGGGLYYKIESTPFWVSKCSQYFDDIISGMETDNLKKYKRYSMTGPFSLAVTLTIPAFCLGLIASDPRIPLTVVHFLNELLFCLFIAAILLSAKDRFSLYVSKLFPTSVFLIGQNIKRYEKQEKKRDNMIFAISIPILITVIFGFVFLYLSTVV